MLHAVVIAALLLAFVFVLFGGWRSLFGKAITPFDDAITDSDKDGVMNNLDKCPCPPLGFGVNINDGCPDNYRITNSGAGPEDKSCLSKK